MCKMTAAIKLDIFRYCYRSTHWNNKNDVQNETNTTQTEDIIFMINSCTAMYFGELGDLLLLKLCQIAEITT
jgi:hypothetical protein